MTTDGWQSSFTSYLNACVILVAVGAFIIWKGRKFCLRDMQPPPRPATRPVWLQFAIGCAIALATVILTLLPGIIAGVYSPAKDGWQPYKYGMELTGWDGLYSVWRFFTVQTLFEELLYRAIALMLFGMMLKWIVNVLFPQPDGVEESTQSIRLHGLIWFWSGTAANLIISGAFAFAHMGNPNISMLGTVNIGLAGLVIGQLFWVQANIWGAWGYHLVWNATLASLGLPVSGIAITANPLWEGWNGARSGLLSGGSFGPEGTLANSVVLFGMFVWLVRWSWTSIRQPEAAPGGDKTSAQEDDGE